MSYTNSVAAKNNFLTRIQLKEMTVAFALSVVIPFLVHLLPDNNGIPMGAILLALFFAPLIAMKYFKFYVGISVALVSPLINFLITGSPRMELLPILTIQLVVFVSVIKFFERIDSFKFVSSIAAYLAAVIVSTFLLVIIPNLMGSQTSIDFLKSSLIVALPGIILLGLANFLIALLKKD